ncbi:hypothetical protein AAC387_Pa07g1633 [Persea americana]
MIRPTQNEKLRRKIKNRESARRSRERKKAYTTQLEIDFEELKKENIRLKEMIQVKAFRKAWKAGNLIPPETELVQGQFVPSLAVMGIEKNTPITTPTPVMVNHGEKPEKFNGTEFKRWQQKMLFYLTTLNLARFLHEEAPTLKEDETDKQVVAAVEAWKHANFLCHNYILNGLDNTLYNVCYSLKTAKELWDSLDKKYKTKDARMKKFVVGRFLDYKMIDSKAVINQVQELQVILHEIHAEGMSFSESFQVAAIIEKLPPLWKDFKNYLKHKRKEMKLEDLIVRLTIEEDNRASEKKVGKNFTEARANVVEQRYIKRENMRLRYESKNGAKAVTEPKIRDGTMMKNRESAVRTTL